MKKLFTSVLMVACSIISAWATDFTGNLAVVVSGTPADTRPTTITVNSQPDGKYEFKLRNFILYTGGEEMGIGNIVLNDVEASEANGILSLSSKQNIKIAEGDAEGVDFWMGPLLSETAPIPVDLSASIANGILKASIDIPFGELTIKVFFSSAVFQIPNSDFELFHKENKIDEPNHWHSFGSCTGSLAGFVKNTPHTAISNVIRPESEGKSSVLVTASKVLGIVANGTITTGRMNAGAMSAADTKNHAFSDLSNTDKDANGDPFYTMLNGHPDAIKVWVKFKQGTPNAQYPYATLNGVITDGTRYQDPEDKTYTNIVAKATHAEIAAGDEWQELTIPFDYASYEANEVEGKAILVTVSTNATPGKGSDGDQLYIDDLSLVYNVKLNGIHVVGSQVDGVSTDKETYEVKVVKEPTLKDVTVDAGNGQAAVMIEKGVITIVVFGEDLMNSKTYTVNYTVDPNVGVDRVEVGNSQITGIYNLNGQRIAKPAKGQVYITKYADGSTVKGIAE